jgi:hypothetical protein
MVAELDNFRAKYPEYGDLDDATLASKLATKYPDAYNDLPSKVQPIPVEPTVPQWGIESPNLYGAYGAGKAVLEQALVPALEGLGLLGGGMLGTPAGPAGNIGGAALGYAGAKKVGEIATDYYGKLAQDFLRPKQKTVKQEMVQSGIDVASGAAQQVTGGIIGKGAGAIIGLGGKAVKGVLGKLTGTGLGAVETALESGPMFKKAIRNEITDKEVAQLAKDALSQVKEIRSTAYQTDLAALQQTNPPINTSMMKAKIKSLLNKYVDVDRVTGKPDWERSAIGMSDTEGVKKIQKIVKDVDSWGTRSNDNTALGLDMLKRQMDDFYSESSNARAFVASARNIVKDTITTNVPQYAQMTKKYADMTNMIKDIESGLLLRPSGISGRLVADQTLRRLVSSMREGFELRKELVEVLGKQAGTDLVGMIAGNSMKPIIPRGLTGSGFAVGGGIMAALVNPKFWPVLAASSPRLSGEFLRMYGKGLAEVRGLSPGAGMAIAFEMNKFIENKRKENRMEQVK